MNKDKVAIYCRLSDEDRHKKTPKMESESIQNQKNMLTSYAIEHNWDIYNIYCDEDYSGADADRPQYNKLLSDAKSKKFNIVLCKTQSRFTRDNVHLDIYVHGKFVEWGIRFISIVDNADTDIKGNKKTRQITGLMDEWYIEDISANVRAVKKSMRSKGLFVGGFAPYGYIIDPEDKHRLIIDIGAADVVRRIFELYISGKSCNAIASILNEEKILNPLAYKRNILKSKIPASLGTRGEGSWSGGIISRILKNETYVGDLVQGKSTRRGYKDAEIVRLPPEDWIIVKNTHEPIISRKQFMLSRQIADRMRWPESQNAKSIYARKLKCGICGATLRLRNTRGNRYYSCLRINNENAKRCHGATIRIDLLNQYIISELQKIIQKYIDGKEISELVKKQNDSRQRIKALDRRKLLKEKKMRENERYVISAYTDKCNGIISEEQFIELNEVFSNDIYHLKQEISELDKLKIEIKLEAESHSYNETVEKIIERYFGCDCITIELIDELIDYISIWNMTNRSDKKIEIHWKF